jgi:type II secretory pathway pseudopilin PulG
MAIIRPKPLKPKVKEVLGFAILEAIVALLVIAFAAATVPIVTVNAKRRMAFNKRRTGAVMARNTLINILTREDNWYQTVSQQLGVGGPFGCYVGATTGNVDTFAGCGNNYPTYFNPTNTAPLSFSVYLAGAVTPFYAPNGDCSAGAMNGFDDNGALCCSAGAPNAACPIQVTFSWSIICGRVSGQCDPNLINVRATFSIYNGDTTDSILGGLGTAGGLYGGKYEFDLVRPAPFY